MTEASDMDAFLRRVIVFICIFWLNIVIERMYDSLLSAPNAPVYCNIKKKPWNFVNLHGVGMQPEVIKVI